jgi:hypothetical protein
MEEYPVGPWPDAAPLPTRAYFPLTTDEADTILGWVEILKLAEPKLGYSDTEKDLLNRMTEFADETI